jgi:hypothetical protein
MLIEIVTGTFCYTQVVSILHPDPYKRGNREAERQELRNWQETSNTMVISSPAPKHHPLTIVPEITSLYARAAIQKHEPTRNYTT